MRKSRICAIVVILGLCLIGKKCFALPLLLTNCKKYSKNALKWVQQYIRLLQDFNQ